jgi:putative serine protease PepD
MTDVLGAARLRILSGPEKGRAVVIGGDEFTVGRTPGSDLVLGDPQVSARHARLTPAADGVLLEDLGSTNGTIVNGQAITGPRLLQGGERLQLGDTHLTITVPWLTPAPPPPPAPTPAPAAPSAWAGPVGLAAAPARLPSETSSVQRLRLVRSSKRTTVLAVVAIAVSVAVLAILLFVVLRSSTSGPPTTPEIVARAAPSTVLVESLRDNKPFASGTGWVLDAKSGFIVTNYHVIRDATSFQVTAGTEARPATVLAAAPCDDTALLKVSDVPLLKTLMMGSQADLRLGEGVVAVGFPVNASKHDQLTATTGVVSVVRTSVDGVGESPSLPNVVQTDAPINPGNSGGPLISSRQLLIGMNTFTLVTANGRTLQNTNYAIGVDRLREVTAQLRTGRSLGWTGASLTAPAASSDLVRLGLPDRPGLVIDSVVPGSPADRAGLGTGPALLVAVDGHAIDTNLTSYCDAVKDAPSGQSVRFSLYRPDRAASVDVPVTLS